MQQKAASLGIPMCRPVEFGECEDGKDPWEEFNRIVWCAQASPLFALYISSNTLFSIPWAIPFGECEIQTMFNQAKDVLNRYDNMRNTVPTWYFKGYYNS